MPLMHADTSPEHLEGLIRELQSLPKEPEWDEFKRNKADCEEIGEYISALANSAALLGNGNGYLVWGIADETHDLVGTSFDPISFRFPPWTSMETRLYSLRLPPRSGIRFGSKETSLSASAPSRKSSRIIPRRNAPCGGYSTQRRSSKGSLRRMCPRKMYCDFPTTPPTSNSRHFRSRRIVTGSLKGCPQTR